VSHSGAVPLYLFWQSYDGSMRLNYLTGAPDAPLAVNLHQLSALISQVSLPSLQQATAPCGLVSHWSPTDADQHCWECAAAGPQ
jgi:hypothetical protein